MRELESSLQEFGEFVLKAQLVRQSAAPYFVRWVRRFLSRPASDEPLMDQVRGFCEDLERNGGAEDWQVRQADQALRIYFVNFLERTDSGRVQVPRVARRPSGGEHGDGNHRHSYLRHDSRHTLRSRRRRGEISDRLASYVAVGNNSRGCADDSTRVRTMKSLDK